MIILETYDGFTKSIPGTYKDYGPIIYTPVMKDESPYYIQNKKPTFEKRTFRLYDEISPGIFLYKENSDG